MIELAFLIKEEEDKELKKLLEQAEYQFVDILLEQINSIQSKVEDALQDDFEELQELIDGLLKNFGNKQPTEKQIRKFIKNRSFNSKLNDQLIPELEEVFLLLLEAFQEFYESGGQLDKQSESYKELSAWLNELPELLQGTTDDAVVRVVGKHYEKDDEEKEKGLSLAALWIFGYARARTIAIQELLRMYSGSQFESMMLDDEVIGIKWRHADGVKEPRPTHVATDGTIIAKGELFYINGVFLRYPRDPQAPISETINCHCFLDPIYYYRYESGAKRRTFEEKEVLANRIYESARNRKSDIRRVAKHSGMRKSDIKKVYRHMFINEYDLLSGKKRFDPDIDMAESWQRLFLGKNVQKHDIIMLRHELMESKLMNKKGLSYRDAHKKVNETWNYENALDEYKDKLEGK
ncbi:hypothetical protein RV00_GL001009 [Enterococcus devriesei]|uniref:Phage head morphogenesis domain-containing protein n=2 Tax=Enterococcus devriesei TaxID=319970 RepID=A0A1L8SP55_9ENTE|nr:hypothetical protein RV00_GL001009 [Enterococcus devriesei]